MVCLARRALKAIVRGWMPLRCSPPAKCGTRPDATLVSEDPQAGLRLQRTDRVGCQRRAERAPWRDQSARQPMQVDRLAVAAGRRLRSRVMAFHGRWIASFSLTA